MVDDNIQNDVNSMLMSSFNEFNQFLLSPPIMLPLHIILNTRLQLEVFQYPYFSFVPRIVQ